MSVSARVSRALLCVAVLVLGGSPAWATSAACTSLSAGTASAPATFANMLGCVFDTLAPYAAIGNLLQILVPVVLVVWGAVAGFRVLRSMFKKGTSAVARA